MTDVTQEMLDAFAADCRKAAGYGLMQCSSGNMSQRIDADLMLISSTRSWMAELRSDQIVVCRIADGAVLNDQRPSVEATFHRGILNTRPDVGCVLHFQSPYATTMACSCIDDVSFEVIPEIPFYVGPIGVVPYIQPGSPELAEAVIETIRIHDLAILQNHGMVSVGEHPNDAIQKAVFFELACGIILRAGERIRPLESETASALYQAGRSAHGKV